MDPLGIVLLTVTIVLLACVLLARYHELVRGFLAHLKEVQ